MNNFLKSYNLSGKKKVHWFNQDSKPRLEAFREILSSKHYISDTPAGQKKIIVYNLKSFLFYFFKGVSIPMALGSVTTGFFFLLTAYIVPSNYPIAGQIFGWCIFFISIVCAKYCLDVADTSRRQAVGPLSK